MEDSIKSRNNKIKEIFTSMDYGENLESVNKASEWLKTVEIVDKSSEIDNILKSAKTTGWKSSAKERKTLLINLAKEIETNSDILSQIEIFSRGILSKDTKIKSLPLLAQYFYYYANFSVRNEKENPNWNPEGVVVAIFNDDNPLWTLGTVLAPALAAGYTVLIQTGTKFGVAVHFLLHLAKKVGIPDDVLILIPSNEGELQPYLSDDNVIVVVLFVDLFNSKYRGINKYNKKLLILSSYNTPIIVFDDCDIDSASASVIDATWGHKGLSPWASGTVLIQENIFKRFTDKLKTKLSAIKIGHGNDKMADISFPNSTIASNYVKILQKAQEQGVDVFQKDSDNGFGPTLFVGMKVGTNNVIGGPEKDGTLTLLAFRFIDEAVNLANNTRQGIGAAVWTENIGLANEVARKLAVNNVWINCHGLSSVEVPITPFKDSGVGYFGGEEGFYQYINAKKSGNVATVTELPTKTDEAIAITINSAKSAAISWSKTTYLNRIKTLQRVTEYLESNRSEFLSRGISETWFDKLIFDINQCSFERKIPGSFSYPGYVVTSTKRSRGVVAIEMSEILDRHNVKLFAAAILEGNAVILINGNCDSQDIYKEISKKLPHGVLTVFPFSLEAVKAAAWHKGLNGYFAEDSNIIFGSLPLEQSKIYTSAADNWADAFTTVTVAKNVWSDVGQSITCDL